MKYFTTRQLADKYGLNDSTIRKWIAQGKLRASKLGRDWVIAEMDWKKFQKKDKKSKKMS